MPSTRKTFVPNSPGMRERPHNAKRHRANVGKLVLTLHVIFVNNSNLVRSDFVDASDKVVDPCRRHVHLGKALEANDHPAPSRYQEANRKDLIIRLAPMCAAMAIRRNRT
uniref:Uncharacterized protein n=1 Tax=Anopheles culicifacies TaxID=139723 RepID=A0A182MS42_9DIPT